MDILFDFGLNMTAWLQTNWGQMAPLMAWVSAIGRFEFYLVLTLLIYWCLDKVHGKHLAYLLVVGGTVVAVLKHVLRPPRPFWFDASLALGEWGGYGFPSGHTFLAVLAFIFIPLYVSHKQWVVVSSLLFIVLTALSRIYLGDHFPHDVLGGLLIALLTIGGYWFWMAYYYEAFTNRIMGQRFWVMVLWPLGAAVLYGLILIILGAPTPTTGQEDLFVAAEVVSYEDTVLSFAVWLGLGVGIILERSRVRFLLDGPVQMRIGRFVLGIILVMGVQFGLRALFNFLWPLDEGLIIAMLLRAVRYYIVAMLGVYYAPRLFCYLGLADAEPEPQITGSLNRLKI